MWHRVYCHWDGYLEHNGRILFDHYTSQTLAEKLVALGDLSVLGPKIGVRHPFDTPAYNTPQAAEYEKRYSGMCLAYGRDRGEKDVAGTVADTLAGCWPENDTWTEFTYVWDDGRWWVGDPDEGSQTLIDLGDALTGKKTLKPAVKAFGMVIGQHAAHDPAKPDDHGWYSKL
jgi:hypothetical protein